MAVAQPVFEADERARKCALGEVYDAKSLPRRNLWPTVLRRSIACDLGRFCVVPAGIEPATFRV